MPSRGLAVAFVAGFLALGAMAGPASGQTSADPDAVVATVDGSEITEAELALAMETLAPNLAQVPEGERRGLVTDLLIDMHLMANAAREEGLHETPAFEDQLEFLRLQALRDVYYTESIEKAVTDEDLRARYDQEVAAIGPSTEVRARHILVEDEALARRLIEEIDGGADFAELARTHSKDPGSGAEGGDLGYFGRGQMVPAFEAAAFALAPGEVTEEPVQSRFGWHVIKVEDVREQEVPAFEDVKDQIRQIVVRESFIDRLEALKEGAEIVRTDAPPAPEAPGSPQ